MKVSFYTTTSGARPVEKYLSKLESGLRGRVLAVFMDIALNGMESIECEFRQIAGKLWEIKTEDQRIFYIVIQGAEMVLLHACKKQKKKASKSDVNTAMIRMNKVLAYE